MVSNLRLEQLLQQGQRNAIAQNEFFSSYLTTYLQVPLQSKEINEEYLKTLVGKRFYFSPEMVTKQQYTAKTDVW